MVSLVEALVAYKKAFEEWVYALSCGADVDDLTDRLEECKRDVEIARLEQLFHEPLLWEGSD
jgi:hypothetical protein